jgi:hypothetical protein
MPNIQFGSGVAVLTPNAGNTAANPTPIALKVLQEGSIEIKSDLKKLFGQFQGAVATARGKVDITGKMKVASFDANDLNQIYFGLTATTGGSLPVTGESHAPAASITPSTGSGLAVVADLGVLNGSNGKSMIKVSSAPAVGQYTFTPAITGGSPTAAVYGFNASETAASVVLSYLTTVTTGTTVTLSNQLMGYAPECQLNLFSTFRNQTLAIQLNQVTFGQMSIPTKQDDFWVADIDFSANVDAAGLYGALYTS